MAASIELMCDTPLLPKHITVNNHIYTFAQFELLLGANWRKSMHTQETKCKVNKKRRPSRSRVRGLVVGIGVDHLIAR